MDRIEIDPEKPLSAGNVVELHFHSVGLLWLTAAQIAAIDSRLKNETHWQIRSWSIPDKNTVIFTVKVLKSNPVIVTVAVIAAAISAVGIIAWLTLSKAYQIIESPGGQVAAAGIGSLGIAAAIIAIIGIFGKSK